MSRTARRLAPATTVVALMLGAGPAMAAPPQPVPCRRSSFFPQGSGAPTSTSGSWRPVGSSTPRPSSTRTGTGPHPHGRQGRPPDLHEPRAGPADPIEGQSIKIKTGGSVSSTRINPDGSQTVTATGHNGLVLFPTDVPAGPSTTHYIGRIVYHVDPTTGVFTLLRSSTTRGMSAPSCPTDPAVNRPHDAAGDAPDSSWPSGACRIRDWPNLSRSRRDLAPRRRGRARSRPSPGRSTGMRGRSYAARDRPRRGRTPLRYLLASLSSEREVFREPIRSS